MRNALLLVIVVAALAACKSKSKDAPKRDTSATTKVEPKPADAAPAKVDPAADPVVARKAAFELAVYFMPAPKVDPHKALAKVLEKHPGLTAVKEPAQDMKLPAVAVREPSINTYAAPPPEVIARRGHGIDKKIAAAVQKSRGVFVMMFFMNGADAQRVHAEALAVASELAEATGGLLWDQETRELFMPDRWSARIKAAAETPPNAVPLLSTREDTVDGATRLVSLGMAKLGLPDVVVDKVSAPLLARASVFAKAIAQTIVEGGGLDDKHRLAVDASAWKSAAARAALVGTGTTPGKALIWIRKVSPQRHVTWVLRPL